MHTTGAGRGCDKIMIVQAHSGQTKARLQGARIRCSRRRPVMHAGLLFGEMPLVCMQASHSSSTTKLHSVQAHLATLARCTMVHPLGYIHPPTQAPETAAPLRGWDCPVPPRPSLRPGLRLVGGCTGAELGATTPSLVLSAPCCRLTSMAGFTSARRPRSSAQCS
jgi:hypothetical protein